jgi:hypothetical protein
VQRSVALRRRHYQSIRRGHRHLSRVDHAQQVKHREEDLVEGLRQAELSPDDFITLDGDLDGAPVELTAADGVVVEATESGAYDGIEDVEGDENDECKNI